MGPIVLLVRNWMEPNVQSGKTRWDQTSSLAKMAWDQMSMGPIVWLPGIAIKVQIINIHVSTKLFMKNTVKSA